MVYVKPVSVGTLPLFCLQTRSFITYRKEQELNESNGNNENLLAQIEALKKKIRELEVWKIVKTKKKPKRLIARSNALVWYGFSQRA